MIIILRNSPATAISPMSAAFSLDAWAGRAAPLKAGEMQTVDIASLTMADKMFLRDRLSAKGVVITPSKNSNTPWGVRTFCEMVGLPTKQAKQAKQEAVVPAVPGVPAETPPQPLDEAEKAGDMPPHDDEHSADVSPPNPEGGQPSESPHTDDHAELEPQWESMTVPALREEIMNRGGVPGKRTKPELIEMVSALWNKK